MNQSSDQNRTRSCAAFLAAVSGIFAFSAPLSIPQTSQVAKAAAPSIRALDLARCVKTPHRNGDNYYQDIRDCSSGKNWTLVVEAEGGTLGQSCVGPVDQSFRVNGANSPVTLKWAREPSKALSGWRVDMKVDTSPGTVCPNQYTFFSFMRHVEHGGGSLPGLAALQTSHTLSYEQMALPEGEARLTIGGQVFWNGKSHILEVLPARIGYRANRGFPPGVLQKIVTPKFDYVIVDDSWGLRVAPDGMPHHIVADWPALFSKAVSLGLFDRPTGETAVQAIYVAVETHNRALAKLEQTEFKIVGSP